MLLDSPVSCSFQNSEGSKNLRTAVLTARDNLYTDTQYYSVFVFCAARFRRLRFWTLATVDGRSKKKNLKQIDVHLES